MNEKIMKIGNHKLFLVVTLLLALVGSFYWYELRPASIRKECANKSADVINKIIDEGGITAENAKTQYDLRFKVCSNKAGL